MGEPGASAFGAHRGLVRVGGRRTVQVVSVGWSARAPAVLHDADHLLAVRRMRLPGPHIVKRRPDWRPVRRPRSVCYLEG